MTACAADTGAEAVATSEAQVVSQGAASHSATYARQWMANLANSVKGDGISPPVASRTYAYGAIAMYEAVVHGMPGNRSLVGQLNGLDALPLPVAGVEYDWPTVLAATMSKVAMGVFVFPLRLFFEYTSETQASLLALGPQQIGHRQAEGVPQAVIDSSVAYGHSLGDALTAWANTDGYPQARFKGYVPPSCSGCWVPTGFSDQNKVALPEEPAFGGLRPLVMSSPNECSPGAPPAYSTDPTSQFYLEAKAVRDTETNLTDEQREVARFWADGPVDTATPAGHWLALVTKSVRTKTLAEATEAYAVASLGYYDAFIAAWQSKYEYNVLRPETYIRRHIQADWRPYLPTPQFPEYISGHSAVSGASAVIMTNLFGNGAIVDDTKLRRGFGVRSFASYTAAAAEAADSRFSGGIHYPFSNSRGLSLGRCVGNAVLSRVHTKL